ncbi:hypothetical protein [Lewinella cohaerens]|uniref:hypothetical protein n=1 Tax=Lewinella cohaerens TaxID=70995 RepID=UPI00037E1CAD|nr:hypothetical protein [Lewinella cohaerens]
MTKTQLQAKIAKMEKGLDNPNIQGAAREALTKSLKTAKEQLAGMSEPKILMVKPSHGKTEQKKAAVPKKAQTSSSPTKNIPLYSWQKKTDLSKLQAVNINCQHYHLKIEKATKVSLKRTGKSAMVVTARPGDHIIFDHEGYAVYIMEAGSFAKKCTTTAAKQPVAKKATAAKPTTKKKAVRKPKAPAKKKAAPKTKNNYTKAIQSFDKEVDNIRTTYKKPEANQEQVKEDLKALAAKSDQKNYTAYVERKIKRLDKDGVRITKEEIIRIGIALRPLVQSVRGTLQDAQNTNRKVLDPTLDNLVRWAKSPGGYDLAGVDAAAGRKATAKAKVTDPEKKGFLEWLFD